MPRKSPKANRIPLELLFEAQIGGYYTYQNDEGTWTLFRMLDVTGHALQCMLFNKHFDHKPTLEEAIRTSPFIRHAPLGKASLFHSKELTLLGGQPITDDDLDGYKGYLEAKGANNDSIDRTFDRLYGLMYSGKATLKLTKIGDDITTEVKPSYS